MLLLLAGWLAEWLTIVARDPCCCVECNVQLVDVLIMGINKVEFIFN